MLHGPFPLRIWRLLGGLAAVFVALAMSILLVPETFTCGPASASASECSVKRGIQSPRRFPRAALTSVTVAEVRGNKATYGIPIVRFTGGEVRLHKGDGARAREFARAANDALSHDAAFDVSLGVPPEVFAIVLAFFAVGIGLLFTALRGIGGYRLQLDAARHSLTVERRLTGLTLSRNEVPTTNVVAVELDWSLQKDFFYNRFQSADSAARLVLQALDGERRLVTPGFHRGYTVHLRAADELAALLGCLPRSTHVAARHEALAQAFRPPPISLRARVFIAWVGLFCGTFASILLYVFIGLLSGLLKPDATEGPGLLWSAGIGGLIGIIIALHATRRRPPR